MVRPPKSYGVAVMNRDIALLFCKVCSWTYEAWVTRKYLFDQNDKEADTLEKAIAFFNRLSPITQEYSLQQIAKLHDPAVQMNDRNVSVDFVVRFGEWGDKEAEIKAIEKRLLEFWGHVKPARNKLLAHNDLEALLADEALGAFPEGEDALYFDALQELANEVHDRWGDGGPYPFDDLAINDVCEFIHVLEKIQ